MNDVVIATPHGDHMKRLDEVIACIKRAIRKRKPSKRKILNDSIKYLRRMVDKHRIRPDPDAVQTFSTLKSK